jgi:endonuclease YncB( thermonuclease family)
MAEAGHPFDAQRRYGPTGHYRATRRTCSDRAVPFPDDRPGARARRPSWPSSTATRIVIVLVAILVGYLLGVRSPGTSGLGARDAAPTAAGTVAARTPGGAASASATAIGTAPFGPTEQARVVRIVDGDTIVVDRGRGNEKLRYIGMDTPETVDPNSPVEWMGPQASKANAALVAGKMVTLEKDVSAVDRYGRLLRDLWVRDPDRPSGWLFVNLELVERGYAQVTTFPPDVRYVDLLLAAQRRARDAGLGLWGPEPSG